jgi:hypothetical protein
MRVTAVIFMLPVLLTATAPAREQPVYSRASCVLALDAAGAARDAVVNRSTVTAMLTSSELIDPAAMEVLKLGPEAWPRVAHIELASAGEHAVTLTVTILPDGDRTYPAGTAKTLLQAIAKRGIETINRLGEDQFRSCMDTIEELRVEKQALGEQIIEVESRLRTAHNVATAHAARHGSVATTSRVQLEQQIQDYRARLKVIRATLAGNQPVRGAPDPVLLEAVKAWEELVEALSEQPESIKLLEARTKLTEARVRLSQQQAAGLQDSQQKWRAEVIRLEIEIASLEERLKRLPETEEEPAQEPMSLEERNKLQQDLSVARERLRKVERELATAGQNLERIKRIPRLILLRG